MLVVIFVGDVTKKLLETLAQTSSRGHLATRMAVDPSSPWSLNDIEAVRSRLRKLASEGRIDEAIEVLLQMLVQVRDDNTALRVRLHNAIRQIYGRKSEKVDIDQLALAFSDLTSAPQVAKDIVEQDAQESESSESDGDPEPSNAAGNQDTVPAPERKAKKLTGKRGRQALPDDLPRETKRILVEDELRKCPDCGADKKTFGFATTETLEFVPAHFKVVVEELEKLACPVCEAGVIVADTEKVMERGLPGPGLLAAVVISKGQDSQPLYRQSDIHGRSHVHIPDSTLGDWFAFAAEVIRPVAQMITRQVFLSFMVNADDTGLRVLDRDHPKGVKRGHIWAFVGDRRYVAFHYAANWKPEHPAQLLAAYRGFVQGDGYAGYSTSIGTPDEEVVLIAPDRRLGCAMHIRRKFEAAYEIGDARGAIALAFFRRLYALEERYKEQGLDAENRLQQRRELSMPVVKEFYAWVDEMHPLAIKGTPFYKATKYATNQREYFKRCFEHGRFEIDNGAVERELRRVRIGEKNYLFAGSDKGAQRIADVYTVLATCRLHGVNPQDYLTDVIHKIQNGWPKSRIAELMPEVWQAARASAAKHVDLAPPAQIAS
jgi:transposase